MGQVWSYEGAAEMLAAMIGVPPPGIDALELLLWKSDSYPTRANNVVDLTECDFGGYARKALVSANWEALPPDDDKRAVNFYNGSPLAWTATGDPPNSVYGWAVVNPVSGATWWMERFDEPREMAADGDFLQVVLRQRLTSELPPLAPPI